MKTVKKLGVVASFAFVVTTVSTMAQENLLEWSQYKNISVNTGASGITGSVTNYPLLVRLTAANAADVFSGSLTGGGLDIRFTNATGTANVPFQRERWDAGGEVAEFWVLASVAGNANDVAVRMYWGKAGAPDSSKGNAVFSTANGFLAVWHMNEATTAVGNTIADATGNGHTGTLALQSGTSTGTAPANVTTAIGVGKNFSGSATATGDAVGGYYFTVNNTSTLLNLNTNTGPFTVSAWVSPTLCNGTATGRIAVISKYVNNEANTQSRAWAMQTQNSSGSWTFTMDPLAYYQNVATSQATEFVSDAPCNEGQLTYVAGRYNNPSFSGTTANATQAAFLTTFTDGLPTSNASATANHQRYSVGNSAAVMIGRIAASGDNNNRHFRGVMDEVRVSNAARSDDWIRLDNETQRSGATAVTLGTSFSTAVVKGGAGTGGFGIRSNGSSVLFLLPADLSGARISVLDVSGREVWGANARAGAQELVWDGIAASGVRATPGGYVARITMSKGDGTSGIAAESRVVILR